MRWEIHNEKYEQANIGVLGVGGGGGNAIKHMISSGVKGVKFISANTDSQALSMIKNAKLIKLGKDLTKGLGAGNDPEKGRLATELSKDEIIEEIKDLEMLFIAAGMGGGTGTGGAPVIAKIAKDLNILTVGIVTTPFKVEGDKRISQAKDGITSLMENIDSLIEIDNEKIFEIFQPDTKIDNAFNEINNVLTNAVKGVSNIILKPSKINVDFADVLTVMSQKGMAIMGYGSARGTHRARDAVLNAINNPFFDKSEVKNAKGLLVNVCSSSSITQNELKEILDEASNIAHPDVEAIPGLNLDESYEENINVIIIATGLRRFDLENFNTHNMVRGPSHIVELESDGYINTDDLNKVDIKNVFGRLKN